MSAIYHTPLAFAASLNAAMLNAPLGELDAALYAIVSGGAEWPGLATPATPSMGYARLFINTSGLLSLVDAEGNVTAYINAGSSSYAYLAGVSGGVEGAFTTGDWRTRLLNTIVSGDSIAYVHRLPFTSGGTYEIQVGDTVEGATSGETAVVVDVVLTGGTWAGGDAEGTLWTATPSGDFSGENLNVGAEINVATTTGSAYNQIHLDAGTYYTRIFCPAAEVDEFQSRLQDVTNNQTLILGGNAYCSGGILHPETHSPLMGQFTLSAVTILEIQCRCAVTGTFGFPSAVHTDYFTTMELWT